MLTILSPIEIESSPDRKILQNAGIDGGWNYFVDHAFLLKEIRSFLLSCENKFPTVLDIGVGNSMLHTFLEEHLSIGIIGVDRIFGNCPFDARDRRMDLCINFEENSFFENNVDLIYWNSSIEHNSAEGIKNALKSSFKALKPGGLLLATFAISDNTHWFDPADQLNLSVEDAELIFEDQFIDDRTFQDIRSEYLQNPMGLADRHRKRFQHDDISYVVGGLAQFKA
jgi:SAM-dependent methyltransferase